MKVTEDGTWLTDVEPDEDKTISLDAYEDGNPGWTCPDCGEQSQDDEPDADEPCDNQGQTHDCLECDCTGETEIDCEECNGSGTLDDDTAEPVTCDTCRRSGKISDQCGECDGEGYLYRHDWKPTPCGWLNSAKVWWEPSKDAVTVTISVGDPRGAFAMEVWRDPEGQLRMRLPHPGMGLPHMTLTEVSPGYFTIG